MRIRPGCEGLCYVGADLTGRGGVRRIALCNMTEEEMRGWLQMDYPRASRYIDEEGETLIMPPIPAIDNQPGAPLPQLPTNETDQNAKSEAKPGIFGKAFKK